MRLFLFILSLLMPLPGLATSSAAQADARSLANAPLFVKFLKSVVVVARKNTGSSRDLTFTDNALLVPPELIAKLTQDGRCAQAMAQATAEWQLNRFLRSVPDSNEIILRGEFALQEFRSLLGTQGFVHCLTSELKGNMHYDTLYFASNDKEFVLKLQSSYKVSAAKNLGR